MRTEDLLQAMRHPQGPLPVQATVTGKVLQVSMDQQEGSRVEVIVGLVGGGLLCCGPEILEAIR